MSGQTYFTTIRVDSVMWKRINRERNPRENIGETLERMLDERDRYRNMIKLDPNAS